MQSCGEGDYLLVVVGVNLLGVLSLELLCLGHERSFVLHRFNTSNVRAKQSTRWTETLTEHSQQTRQRQQISTNDETTVPNTSLNIAVEYIWPQNFTRI